MPKAKQGWIHKKLKLSHHRHSFKRLPHQHTSHGLLLALTLVSGVFMFWTIKSYVSADALTGSGFLGLTGRVRPTQAATLDQPLNKQTFYTKIIDVKGTCPTVPPGNIIRFIDNGITTIGPCNNGTYDIKVDLFGGVNFLRARAADIYGDTAPDSNVIRVYFYYPLLTSQGGQAGQSELHVSGQSQTTGATGKAYNLMLTTQGGREPYAFNVNWGDGNSDVISRSNPDSFTINHIYQAAGQAVITVNASDSQGQKAYTQTTALITGPDMAPVTQSPIQPTYISSTLKWLLPTYAVTFFGVFSFWLGQVLSKYRVLHLPKIHLLRH